MKAKTSPKGRKRLAQRIKELQEMTGGPGWPDFVVEEIRAIRGEEEESRIDRNLSSFVDSGSTACSICGELGEHACLPLMHELLETIPTYAQYCWEIAKKFEGGSPDE